MQLDIDPSHEERTLPALRPPFVVEGHAPHETYEVRLSGADWCCTCCTYGRHRFCSHVAYLEDIWSGDGRRTGVLWLVKSAFHKELRRGDLTRALAFGRLFAHMNNNSTVKRYVHDIVFEETRDLGFADWAARNVTGKAANWIDFTLRMVSTTKKWEVAELSETEPMLTTFRANTDLSREVLYVGDRARTIDSLADAYGLFAEICHDERAVAEFGRVLLARSAPEVATSVGRYLQRHALCFNVTQALIDLVFVPGAGTYSDIDALPSEIDLFDLPRFRPYVFDNHVRAGKWRMKSDPFALWEGRQPVGVDLRWSGAQVRNL